jgi:hypothetical protein
VTGGRFFVTLLIISMIVIGAISAGLIVRR